MVAKKLNRFILFRYANNTDYAFALIGRERNHFSTYFKKIILPQIQLSILLVYKQNYFITHQNLSTMKKSIGLLYQIAIFFSLFIGFNACTSSDSEVIPDAPDIDFYVLSTGNQLNVFNAKNLKMAKSTLAISNLAAGESILAIDFRPATGQLYGLGSTSRLYTIDLLTGRANALGATAFTPAISGSDVGFDFNPTVDRIRLVSSNGQNLRLHPELGTVAATDGAINGASAGITSSAYTENFAGSSTTTLFNIDPQTDMLYKQDPPNNGTLVAVGSLGVDVSGNGGFDISSTNVGLAVYSISGKPTLLTVNTTTGKAEVIGTVGTLTNAIGIAIPTSPVAYAVNDANMLSVFNPESPAPISKAITGLSTGENILGIDFRPATGQLIALGSTSRLYVINTATAAATALGTEPFAPLLSGTSFGFDFNPTVDRIRVVSNTGQNLRLNPNDGKIAAVDGALNPTSARVSAAAYTNNFAGSTATVLFDIDHVTGKLYKQDPPNNGTLVEVGSLGVATTETNGFDIGGTSNKAWALLNVGGITRLYSINLTSGMATAAGSYNFTGNYRGFAVGLGF
jgi:hypothetical protein